MSEPRKVIQIAGLCLLAFVLNLSYSVARPATESLFLEAHGSRNLPWAWLLVAVGIAFVVTVYNRFIDRSDLIRIYGTSALLTALLLVVLQAARIAEIPGSYYALYAWKDIYMVVMVEIYYSFANSIFPIRSARWLYGLFGAVGAVGGVIGNLAGGFLAIRLGTASVLWFVLPPLILMWLGCLPFSRLAASSPRPDRKQSARVGQALRVVRKSSYLLLMLTLVALAQIIVTTVDYEYNHILETSYPDADLRTALTGQVYAVVQTVTAVLHALSGPILRLAGVPLVLLAVPFLLCLGLFSFALMPGFATAAIIKVATKVFDYTLFRNAKECLYIPLSYDEITRGKSIVDMFTYRMAKMGASLLLLGLIAIQAVQMVTPMTFLLIVMWFVVTVVVVRRFRRKVSRAEEMASLSSPAEK